MAKLGGIGTYWCHKMSIFHPYGYASKKGYLKNPIGPLVKGKIDQNLWSLGVFFLTHSHDAPHGEEKTRPQHSRGTSRAAHCYARAVPGGRKSSKDDGFLWVLLGKTPRFPLEFKRQGYLFFFSRGRRIDQQIHIERRVTHVDTNSGQTLA